MSYLNKSTWFNPTKARFIGLYLTMVFIVVALLGIFYKGINLGIDFTGGFITEFETSQTISQQDMQQLLDKKIDGNFILTSADKGARWFVRQPDENANLQTDKTNTSNTWLTELAKAEVFLTNGIIITPLDSDYIGTQLGDELIEQGGLAMLSALIVIMLYLWARFEWRFAAGAIIALFHDVLVVIGFFAWTQLEFNLTVLASLLAIIGYSLNDSIIVADRVRELMRVNHQTKLDDIINNAISSTLTRTMITSGTTLITIAAIWWLAGEPLAGFSVALFVGIVVGTLSSICISATFPELVGLDVEHYKKLFEEEELLAN